MLLVRLTLRRTFGRVERERILDVADLRFPPPLQPTMPAEQLPPKAAIEILRKAGSKGAMVSSSSDDGTQKLYAEAPDLVIPVLRPYRQRGEFEHVVA